VQGQSCSVNGVGVEGLAGVAGAIPIVAKGAASQSANLMEFEKSCGAALSVFNKSGWLGIGAKSAPTTLHVNGSLSAKTVKVSKNYTMTKTDFAVLASGAITVTLPAAKTSAGMIVFIKNVNTSATTVTVKPAGSDNIDNSTAAQSLSAVNSKISLVSDGTTNWYVLST